MRFFSAVLYLLSACVVASCEAQVRSENPVDAATKDASHDAADGGDGGDGGVSVDASSLGSCAQPGECALVTRTCCGVCGAPAVTDMDAVRWDETETHHNELCGAGPVNCPRCAIMTNPHLGAICRASHCAAVDVRTDATSSCTTDADCMLRFGLSCCEMCAGTDADLIAIRKDALHDLTTCAPNEGACPPCVPTYPTSALARCNAQTRHCEVARTP